MIELPTHALFNNLLNKQFERLTVIEYKGKPKTQHRWLCRCVCGNEKIISACDLTKGHTRSCGCLYKGNNNAKAHGHVGTATYHSWQSMLQRCRYTRDKSYHNYGGRGITVCADWSFFINFLRDMGERPVGKTLDRIDVNGNYNKENCRWATREEQDNNMQKHIERNNK